MKTWFVWPLLWPPSLIYRLVTWIRNLCFQQELLGSYSVVSHGKIVPVLCVGNLTSGGTGKTPLTALLIEGFLKRGRQIGVVSRGYGARRKLTGERVPTTGTAETAEQYGDEPTWLAHRFGSSRVPVFVGADRVRAAQALASHEKVDLILADDGFQHRRLNRVLDAVVIDATEPRWHYRSLPLGRQRESFRSLRRAHAVFLTKLNLANMEQVTWLKEQIRIAAGSQPLPIFEMDARITSFSSLDSGVTNPLECFQNKKILLVSGIGRPETFSSAIGQACGAVVVGHKIYRDHYNYRPDDLRFIEAEVARLGADSVAMTEKDAVKLTAWRPPFVVWVSRMETIARQDIREFYELADRLLF